MVKLDEEGRMLTLVLAPEQRLEKPLRLVVRFADEGAPASAEFRLVVHPAHAETHVEVYRQPRSAEVCCEEAQAEREKARQCEAALARTRTECHDRGGLIGLRAEGLMGGRFPVGVRAQPLDDRKLTFHPANALAMRAATTLLTPAPGGEDSPKRVRVAVCLKLKNLGAGEWEATGAQLAAPGGVRPETRVWQSAPLAPGVWEVMVEAELTQEETRGRFTLKLWDASGSRTFSVAGVTFP